MVVIYVLRLERGKFYVGMTRRNIQRIWEHIDGEGAKWTKKYPPLEGREVVFMKDGLHKIDEDRITIEQMREHGYHNVRGGQWCQIKLNETQIKTIKKKIKELPKQKSKSRPDIGQYYRNKAMNRKNQKNKIMNLRKKSLKKKDLLGNPFFFYFYTIKPHIRRSDFFSGKFLNIRNFFLRFF